MIDNTPAQFLTTFLVAFTAYHLVAIVRTLGFISDRWKEKKPIGCDVCMAFWTALVVALFLWLVEFCTDTAKGSTGDMASVTAELARHLLRFTGAAGLCYFMLRHTPPPAMLP